MVELVHAGRSEELAREFEPTAQSIKNWVGQAERDVGRADGGLTRPEREELNRLRRENRQLRLEREIARCSRSRNALKPQALLGQVVQYTNALLLFRSGRRDRGID
jgi:transposase-like protein